MKEGKLMAKMNDQTKERIFQLITDGHTQESVAKLYKVSQSTISNIYKEMKLVVENNGLKKNIYDLAEVGAKALGNAGKAAIRLIEKK
jgi:DNA invertase Pin-like site-specific DNA recombinase